MILYPQQRQVNQHHSLAELLWEYDAVMLCCSQPEVSVMAGGLAPYQKCQLLS